MPDKGKAMTKWKFKELSSENFMTKICKYCPYVVGDGPGAEDKFRMHLKKEHWNEIKEEYNLEE
jgi:hypothetical protein